MHTFETHTAGFGGARAHCESEARKLRNRAARLRGEAAEHQANGQWEAAGRKNRQADECDKQAAEWEESIEACA